MRSFAGRIITLGALLSTLLVVPVGVSAQADETCEAFPETNQEICGIFLTYWESNGGLPVFGMPLTPQFSELSADTLTQHDAQYYERERFEHHPENEGTPYVILLGRLGVNVLVANGIDWMTLPKANPSAAHFMPATGQAIAPEFWGHWSSHGLDFGDEGVSFRESLALFGYPVSPAELETNGDGDTVLTQWFERARFELHEDGMVLLGRLGAEVTASDADFSIRVETELNAMLRLAFSGYDAHGVFARVEVEGVGEWTGILGEANPDTGAPYTADTHHRIGSVTKTFVATLVLQLVGEGALSLDDTLDHWFPDFQHSDAITLRDMLSMTSGVADYADNPEMIDQYVSNPVDVVFEPEELVAYAAALPPQFAPGADWNYCNTNYVMLGLIIEAVTGQDIREVLQERIFEPLGYTATIFPPQDDTDLPEPYARGITTQTATGAVEDSTFWTTSWTFSAGQLISTYEDLTSWARVLGTGELLSPEMQAERASWWVPIPNLQDVSYGLGIFDIDGWIGHDGQTPGYTSFVLYNAELDATITVMVNSDVPNADGQVGAPGVTLALIPVVSRTSPPLYD